MHAGKAYFPDFLVWIDKEIVAIDTKGTHLLLEASASKLFEIGGSEAGRRIVLRLVSEGHVEISNGTIHTRKTAGFTVWVWRHGRPQPIFCDTEKEAAEISIRLD